MVGVAGSPAGAATVPDAPAAPTTVAGDAQILATFSAPGNDGGSPVLGYRVTCTSSNGGAKNHADATSETPVTVTGLTNGKTYTCTVDATNAEGTSPESDPSSPAVIPSTVADPPAAPTVVAGDAKITVSFNPPAHNGGSAITGYTATCSGGPTGSASDTNSPIVVTGLTNGASYTCAVTANNANGPSAPSPPSAAAVPGSVPGPPLAPLVTLDTTKLVVNFLPPADNGGRPITSYDATCTGGPAPITGTEPLSPITIDAERGNTYTCTVTATNAIGTGPASVASAPVVIPATAPSAPARPTVERGNKKVVVTFVPPASNGSPIISYSATCTGGFVPVTKVWPSSTIAVTGLTNGTSYTCKATATNAIGTSLASPASLPVVPAAVPDPPAQPTVVRSIGKIVVRFSAPNNNGSPIQRYTATCASSNGGVARSTAGPNAPISVGGLTNGRIYVCYVTAQNIVGASPRSLPSVPTIPGTAPAPPTITSVLPGKAPGPTGPLIVAIKPGSNNGTPISSYRATCTSAIAGDSHTVTSVGSPITVSGLVTARDYTCRAEAISTSGTSRVSAAVAGQQRRHDPPLPGAVHVDERRRGRQPVRPRQPLPGERVDARRPVHVQAHCDQRPR